MNSTIKVIVFCVTALFSFSAVAADGLGQYFLSMGGESPIASTKIDKESAILLASGGSLRCYSDKNGNNKIWTGNSAHNCCSKKGANGKSWTCPSYNNGAVTKCSQNQDYHCP